MEQAHDEIELKDGRRVRRDTRGRYRDSTSGKWLSAAQVEALRLNPGVDRTPNPQALLEAALRQGALEQGLELESSAEVFANVIRVQTEIALDKSDPAKATAAARLLTKTTGLITDLAKEDADRPWFVLGRELAGQVLSLIKEERERRGPREENKPSY